MDIFQMWNDFQNNLSLLISIIAIIFVVIVWYFGRSDADKNSNDPE